MRNLRLGCADVLDPPTLKQNALLMMVCRPEWPSHCNGTILSRLLSAFAGQRQLDAVVEPLGFELMGSVQLWTQQPQAVQPWHHAF